MVEKTYNIYAKGRLIYSNLSEEEFTQMWSDIDKFLQVSGAMKKEDLNYKIVLDKDIHNSV